MGVGFAFRQEEATHNPSQCYESSLTPPFLPYPLPVERHLVAGADTPRFSFRKKSCEKKSRQKFLISYGKVD